MYLIFLLAARRTHLPRSPSLLWSSTNYHDNPIQRGERKRRGDPCGRP